ncbi:hypothetical protein [Nocardioides pantholopis]|uniref:hypothetical protein n=1 Tax=Nocardioides pantholopis TaxID=2483798 RepID=UPI000F093091|nr:hypothetical protein [Nocardioides pantholopis]
MQLRRTFALVSGTLLLTAPLGACGFDVATDRMYTPAAGTNARDYDVDILNAVVVTGQPGSGTFVTALSNASAEPVTLRSISAPGVEIEGFEPIEVPADNGFVNLEDEDIYVTGDVEAGLVIPMTLKFDNGDTVEIDVPTVTNCDEFEGLDTSVEAGGGAAGDTDGSDEVITYSCEVEHAGGGH